MKFEMKSTMNRLIDMLCLIYLPIFMFLWFDHLIARKWIMLLITWTWKSKMHAWMKVDTETLQQYISRTYIVHSKFHCQIWNCVIENPLCLNEFRFILFHAILIIITSYVCSKWRFWGEKCSSQRRLSNDGHCLMCLNSGN